MGEPTISIVTPSYNQAKYIEWTVRSVILQRYPKLEYVVMDGGSTDHTSDILKRYEPHFHYVVSAPDKGQSDAIRRGFSYTSGEIMGYLNSDDLLAPDTLYWVADFFARHSKVDAVYSHRCAVNAANEVIWHWYLPPHISYLMKRWDLIPQETCFWRRRIYDAVGGVDSSFDFAMDYDLFVKFMNTGRMRRADRFLGAFRQHSEAKTSRELENVGAREIQRVWADNKITPHRWDEILGATFSRLVELRSYVFSKASTTRPGVFPRLGYNYDSIWAGQLTSSRIPPARSHARSQAVNLFVSSS